MGKRTPFSFIRDQYAAIPSITTLQVDMSGRTIVVVGASSGIGLETARHLASMRPKLLILGCRDAQKGVKALESIRQSTGYSTGQVISLDLLSFDSIRAFVSKLKEETQTLDLLVLNAEINTELFKKSADGYESMLQTNHLGGALLSILLLPHLLHAQQQSILALPRLVVVSTDGHYWANVSSAEKQSEDLMHMLSDETYCDKKVMSDRYNTSKLINLLFTRALASRLQDSPLVITSVTPGWCRSALNRDLTFPLTVVNALLSRIFARSAEAGARIVVHACVGTCIPGGSGREMHGRFLCKCHLKEESDFAVSEEGRLFEEKIWSQTLAVLSANDEDVSGIVNQYLS